MRLLPIVVILAGIIGISLAEDPSTQKPIPIAKPNPEAVKRGKEALLTKAYTPAPWSKDAYENLWKVWGLKEKPADFEKQVYERYGIAHAPYPNNNLPMGLREGNSVFGAKGITSDCMMCHAGSIFGKSYIGLPNSSLDFQRLYKDLLTASKSPVKLPFRFTTVRGTTEAAAMVIYLMQFRDADLNLVAPKKFKYRVDLCEDTPAWWLLKKKKTMYHTGSAPSNSVRSIMQFMLTPFNSGEYIKKQEKHFADIQAYLQSIEPPKYPLKIDRKLAARGKVLFEKTCARCHGTYGDEPSYPNKIVPLKTIGTDPLRAKAFSLDFKLHFATTWFIKEKGPDGKPLPYQDKMGYQAPPLDGIWATAPYFHNGSVPTIYHVLNSKARPKIFTRSFGTSREDYDEEKVGWKIKVLDKPADEKLPAWQQRRIYDTTIPGRRNTGHPFGDKFTEEERKAVIEYLKTL